jgi:hypothetical protein
MAVAVPSLPFPEEAESLNSGDLGASQFFLAVLSFIEPGNPCNRADSRPRPMVRWCSQVDGLVIGSRLPAQLERSYQGRSHRLGDGLASGNRKSFVEAA